MTWRIEIGDCRDVLAQLPERSVHTCVTSPPYFGLRDYGTGEWKGGDPSCDHRRVDSERMEALTRNSTLPNQSADNHDYHRAQYRKACGKCGAERVDRQIGLEPTPDEFVAALVAVFREVRRVLRDDGTVWLNLGDSYAANGTYQVSQSKHQAHDFGASNATVVPPGCKPKDLLGVPWMVAFALRQPYYAGTITNELDRVWLAAMIDAEGCVYIHRRPEGASNGQGYVRKADSFGSGLEVANTSLRVVERCKEITGRGSISRQDKDRRQPLYRWCLRTNECREVLREVYPYLVAKQHEARIACGVPSSGERATAAWEALKILHGGGLTDVDFKAPESLHTPGWYLRSDVIWSKLNPMPESVTDRPTKAHEYVFLLSKGPRYFYDADAIREAHAPGSVEHREKYPQRSYRGGNGSMTAMQMQGEGVDCHPSGRNKRSVWTVAAQPYAGAHFATFPPKLIEPCVLAGAPERACGECGAPWERVVERTPMIVRPTTKRTEWQAEDDHARTQTGGTMTQPPSSRTIGFEPLCECNADPVPGVVLDPFAGAGTTLLVADRLGRDAIGIELNPEYAALARGRVIDDAPLFAPEAELANHEQLAFDGEAA